jgi:protein-S-isoprenylcysteine O-methyltransferase Ste14
METTANRTAKPGALSSVWSFLVDRRIRVSQILVFLLIPANLYLGVVPNHMASMENPLGPVGLATLVLGVLLRSWAAGVIRKNDELATSGPYALTRHPLHAGTCLQVLGVCAIVGHPVNLVALLVFGLAVYGPMVRREEATLAAKFGEKWTSYVERMSRFLPRRASRDERVGWSARQWVRNGEYESMGNTVVVLLLLELWRRLAS